MVRHGVRRQAETVGGTLHGPGLDVRADGPEGGEPAGPIAGASSELSAVDTSPCRSIAALRLNPERNLPLGRRASARTPQNATEGLNAYRPS
jgi:hypothetical protein